MKVRLVLINAAGEILRDSIQAIKNSGTVGNFGWVGVDVRYAGTREYVKFIPDANYDELPQGQDGYFYGVLQQTDGGKWDKISVLPENVFELISPKAAAYMNEQREMREKAKRRKTTNMDIHRINNLYLMSRSDRVSIHGNLRFFREFKPI